MRKLVLSCWILLVVIAVAPAPAQAQAVDGQAFSRYVANLAFESCLGLRYRGDTVAFLQDQWLPAMVRRFNADLGPEDVEIVPGPNGVTLSTDAVGRVSRTAAFVRGRGCVIVPEGQTSAPLAPAHPIEPRPRNCGLLCVWPRGERVGPAPAGVDRAALDAVLQARVQNGTTFGVLVVHRGRIVGERYAPGFDRASKHRLASVSKAITASAIATLSRRGAVELDARAPIPALAARTDGGEQITTRQLIRQTSGLLCGFGPPGDYHPIFDGTPTTPFYSALALEFAPGTRWEYRAACNLMLAEEVIRQRTGSGYRRYVQRALFDPLGIDGIEKAASDVTGLHLGHTGYQATVRDLARLGLLYARDGRWIDGRRLLPAGWTAAAARGNTEPDSGWLIDGLACGVHGTSVWIAAVTDPRCEYWPSLPDGAYVMLGAGHQVVAVIPETDTVIVRVGMPVPGRFLGAPGSEDVQDRIFAEVLEQLPAS